MNIKYHKRFEKQFKKLLEKDKQKVIKIVDLFIVNHQDRRLRNYSLKGTLLDKRSISAGPNLRIIFEEFNNYTLVVFLDLGKHNRVYN